MLAGDDPQRLQEAADALARELRTIRGLGSISSSASLLRPELVIVPDRLFTAGDAFNPVLFDLIETLRRPA